MPGLESVPDPDRDDSPVSPSQAPPVMSFCWLRHVLAVISNIQVFDPDSTEESDDAEETQDEGHGYEPINQEEAFGDGSEEQEEEEEVSIEDQVAALVRAAQSDAANLSGQTREELERAEEERRVEEAREKADIWQAAPREDSIELDDVKVATIKSLMSNISLPHAPSWAKDGQDQEWRKKL